MSDNLPRMDYRQHRRARRLVHECCNYDEGNCLLLDDGEPCVCVQSISFSLMCRWLTKAEMSRFRAFQTRINQGFFRGCQRVRDTFILFPRKQRSKCVQTVKINPNTGR